MHFSKASYIQLLASWVFLISGCAEKAKPENSYEQDEAKYTLDGQAVFQQACASCHNPMKDATGPALNSRLISNRTDEWLFQLINDRTNLSKDSLYWARVKRFEGNECAPPALSKQKFKSLISYLRSGISCNLKSPQSK